MLLIEHALPFWRREKPGATVTLVTGVEMLKEQRRESKGGSLPLPRDVGRACQGRARPCR